MMTTFKPVKKTSPTNISVYTKVDAKTAKTITDTAQKLGIKQPDFIRQAILYALDNMELDQ